ncbi:MAG: hypothetical protein MI755_21220 [Sphingomonadales bacterium]|nr:hypothetical protein [Sphingomonadales bacterium]
MPYPPEFDQEVYFGIVAENLIRTFGDRALDYAVKARRRMDELGDCVGLELWRGIERQMLTRHTPGAAPATATLH